MCVCVRIYIYIYIYTYTLYTIEAQNSAYIRVLDLGLGFPSVFFYVS